MLAVLRNVAVFLLAVVSLAAQPTPASDPPSLDLAAALRLATDANPLLQEAASRTDAAAALRTQADTRPNPRLIFQVENLRAWERPGFRPLQDTDNFAYLSQVFERGNKRALRTAYAQANYRVAQSGSELTRAQIISRVKAAYWQALGAQRLRGLYARQAGNLEQFSEYTRNRVREGVAAEIDLIRVELEAKRYQLLARGSGADEERALGTLQQALGRGEGRWTLSEPLEGVILAPAYDVNEALRRRAEVQVNEATQDAARAYVDLQRAQARQDVETLFGYKRTGGFDTLIVGAQMNLPIFNRNTGNIRAAEAGVRETERRRAALEAQIRAELDAAWREFQVRREVVERNLPAMLTQASENRRLAEGAYREGGTDLLRLLDAQRTELEMQVLSTQAWIAYRLSQAALEAALGVY